MDILNLSIFKLNVYEGELPSEDILNEIIKDCSNSNKNFLFEFSTHYVYDFDENCNSDDRINYLTTLVNLLLNKITKQYYTEDDIKLYIHYAALINDRHYVVNDFNKLIRTLESLLDLSPSTESEWYIKENLKYLLLEYYITQISTGDNTNMKNLLIELKETQDKFKELREKYEG